VRFNRALLDEVEIANTQNPNQASFLRCIADEMNFSAFSHLENSYIPIRLFFDGLRPTIEEASDSQFHKWSNRLKNEAEWIERRRCCTHSGKGPKRRVSIRCSASASPSSLPFCSPCAAARSVHAASSVP